MRRTKDLNRRRCHQLAAVLLTIAGAASTLVVPAGAVGPPASSATVSAPSAPATSTLAPALAVRLSVTDASGAAAAGVAGFRVGS